MVLCQVHPLWTGGHWSVCGIYCVQDAESEEQILSGIPCCRSRNGHEPSHPQGPDIYTRQNTCTLCVRYIASAERSEAWEDDSVGTRSGWIAYEQNLHTRYSFSVSLNKQKNHAELSSHCLYMYLSDANLCISQPQTQCHLRCSKFMLTSPSTPVSCNCS